MKTIAFVLILQLIVGLAAFPQEGPGPAAVVRVVNNIEFTGNTVVSSEDLLKAIPIKPGDLVTTAKIERSITAIQQLYRDRGYLAVVSGDIVSGLEETGTLTFPITEVRVSEVRLEGLQKTKEATIRKILKLKPGDLYSTGALSRDADRLNSLGIFDSIDATLEPAAESGMVIIVWHFVERKKTGYVTLGGSYGPAGGLIGSVSVIQSNLRGKAEQIKLTANIGGIEGRPSYLLDYYNPALSSDSSLNVSAFDAIRYRFSTELATVPDLDRYFERRAGASFTIREYPSDFRQITLSPRYESVKVSNLPLQLFTVPMTSANGTVAAVAGGITMDRRDSTIYPTSGHLWSGLVEPEHISLTDGGSKWAAKLSGRYLRFRPLQKISPLLPGQEGPAKRPRVLALRLEAGTSVGQLPFFEQYFLGGVIGLRGYRTSRFWGKQMALGSVELRQPLGRSFTGLLFVDAGDAWGSQFQFQPGVITDFDQHKNFSPHAGAGFGFRYVSNLGSLGLDFAWGEQFRTELVFGETF